MNSSTYYWYKYGFVILWCCWCVMSGLSLSHHDESDSRTRDTVNNSRRKLQSLEQPPPAPQQESYSKSVGFYLMDWDFTCESVPCDASTNSNLETLQQAYVHMVIGTDHPTSFGLLVYRMCEVFQKCIRPQNVKLILQHQLLEDSSVSYANCSNFLRQIDVEFYDWWGKFTVDNKMRQSYRLLDTKNIQDDKRIIYQTDIDEVPDPKLFALALKELASGSCDAIRGMWRDRIAVDGSLAPVNIDSKMSLEQQFPLRCDISNNVVGAGMTRKVIAYRSNYRIDGGQHDLWCDREGDLKLNGYWNKSKACTEHIVGRNKAKLTAFIMPHLAGVNRRPKYCKQEVVVDHYKFLFGIEAYLRKRIYIYKKEGFHWWKDSRQFLDHFKKHNGKVCIDCLTSNCRNMVTDETVNAVADKVF